MNDSLNVFVPFFKSIKIHLKFASMHVSAWKHSKRNYHTIGILSVFYRFPVKYRDAINAKNPVQQ